MSTAMRTRAGLTALYVIVFALQACQSLAYLPGQQTMGRLRTIGPNVYVNDKPARDGQMLTVRDHVRTGGSSSAYIHYLGGGFVQLDEHTDPIFDLAWDGTECGILILGIRIGQAYQEAGHQCRSEVKSSHASWIQPERQFNIFNIKVDDRKTVFTLLDGKIELSKPTSLQMQSRQQITVSASGVEQVRMLSDPELEEVTRWRKKFPTCTPDACFAVGGAAAAGQCTD